MGELWRQHLSSVHYRYFDVFWKRKLMLNFDQINPVSGDLTNVRISPKHPLNGTVGGEGEQLVLDFHQRVCDAVEDESKLK